MLEVKYAFLILDEESLLVMSSWGNHCALSILEELRLWIDYI